MEHHEFIEHMRKLSTWFSGTLRDGQFDLYWQKLKFIPEKAFEEIIDGLIETNSPNSRMPAPDAIKAEWRAWQQANPERTVADVQQTDCDHCQGLGSIDFEYIPDSLAKLAYDREGLSKEDLWDRPGYIYRSAGRCPHCENWKLFFSNPNFPFVTQDNILEKGWRLLDPHRKIEPMHDLKALMDMSTRSLDDFIADVEDDGEAPEAGEKPEECEFDEVYI